MDFYFPIAGVPENVLVLILLGGGIGVLSGMLGVGGGFLLTPLLIHLGVPPPVAVASGANQVVGVSVAGAISHWRRGSVDVKMGLVLTAGGILGSSLGAVAFRLLKSMGQIDFVISLFYVTLLGGVGALMVGEAAESLSRQLWKRPPAPRAPRRLAWIKGLPWRMRFRTSMLYISAVMPLAVGFVVGFLSAIMGVGGGFIGVPAMIYLIGIPTRVAVGTSLLQTTFVTANVTFLHAFYAHTVDVALMAFLLASGVLGAQAGVRFGWKLPATVTRMAMAAIVLAVAAALAYEMARRPDDLYSLAPVE